MSTRRALAIATFAASFASCLDVPGIYPCAEDGQCTPDDAANPVVCVTGECLPACNLANGLGCASGQTCTMDLGFDLSSTAWAALCAPNCDGSTTCPTGLTCGGQGYCVACTPGAQGCPSTSYMGTGGSGGSPSSPATGGSSSSSGTGPP